ncbi:3-methyl-2-oxobutanoate hydroxymethyltransferase [Roseobacter litoralis]|uniref:3-methyl-2-oxobutanoate hydroxymethyltransferase n=1 Tax=Roseobacter litoralis (strain ATCC 49566 / DSM 6996 / JCM 21268 / NBRC 15278 / OCh 149) TaxID=391595 RepID=F7ZM40_ROSLO|nr:3-methyl-2-oxobutanoate hydroxymethyltransferase [Roseobacter litoralis]AEI96377.1 3-methyl-2-oxobutanoate hydroxymethyltransferase PanB [Roseobacter litoralis Och 149]
MSATARQTAPMPVDIKSRKGGEPIVSLTAYTTPMAQMMDAHCDIVLVGDSVGMVLHGLPSTLEVTMEMMILHGRAVSRGLSRAMMVIDMPFGSYEQSSEQAFENAAQLMRETGAGAVKLEGGQHMAQTIEFLVQRGIPVMAHIGLTPQSINTLGGYKVQGRGPQADVLMQDAKAVAAAGAFSVVLEKTPQGLSDEITASIDIPTIGIGASAGCDGQILVVDDMLGLFTAFKAKFVKRYADLGDLGEAAIAAYAADVRARRFPGPEHVFADAAPKVKAAQ